MTAKKAPELGAVARRATELLIEEDAKKIAKQLAKETMVALKDDPEFMDALREQMVKVVLGEIKSIDSMYDLVGSKEEDAVWKAIQNFCIKALKEKLSG